MRCSAAREAGTCANTGSFYIDQIEQTVLRGIMYELRHPEALKAYVEEYQKAMARQRRDVGRKRAELQKDHSAICVTLDRLVAAVSAPWASWLAKLRPILRRSIPLTKASAV